MSYSAHRPGRFDSDGQIEFETPTVPDEPLYLNDVLNERERASSGVPNQTASADVDRHDDAAATSVIPPLVAEPRPASNDTVPFEADEEPDWAAENDTALPAEPESQPAPTRSTRAERPRAPRMSKLRRLAVLGGADGDVLDAVPNETPRFVQMFFVLLGTALVSGISMYFALTTAVQVWIAIALPLAVLWTLIIFNLDRFLTSSMRSTRSRGKLIALAAPRVVMAALIGIVVAEPLVLQIFHNDVIREVTATNLTQAQSDQDVLASGPESQALEAARSRLADLENQAATGIVAGTSGDSAAMVAAQASVDKLTAALAAQQTVIDQARAIYQCELTGEGAGTVAGCTGVAGEGTSSDAAQAQLQQAQSSYDALAEQLREANAQLATAETAGGAAAAAAESTNRQDAEAALPAAREAYETARAAYDARAAEVASGNSGAVGLLSQITALNSLSEREPTLGWAHWLIAALFFMIELLPVLVKVLTSYGNPSVYEQADEIRKQVALDRVTAEGWRERAEIATARSVAPRTS